jgi:hypothetical protein
VLLQGCDGFAVVLKARASTALDGECREPALCRQSETASVAFIRDDDGDFRTGDAAFGNSVRQRQHVRAATGNQNA